MGMTKTRPRMTTSTCDRTPVRGLPIFGHFISRVFGHHTPKPANWPFVSMGSGARRTKGNQKDENLRVLLCRHNLVRPNPLFGRAYLSFCTRGHLSALFPLTPALSLREREKYRQFVGLRGVGEYRRAFLQS